MPILKLLIMGLPASGKTTLIKNVFEKKRYDEMKPYNPTFGVNIGLYNYPGAANLKISTFDCGGQTSFIDTYFTDQWVPRLFEETTGFIFMVDSSAKDRLEEAAKLFNKYLENVLKYSMKTTVYVLASKWDKQTLTSSEIKRKFGDIAIHPVSVVDDSARKMIEKIVSDLSERK